jgi:hypothetical protein
VPYCYHWILFRIGVGLKQVLTSLDKPQPLCLSRRMKEKISRTHIIKSLVEIPSKADRRFWQREMVLLKKLEKIYGIDFLAQIQEDKKVPTLAFFFADWKKKLLDVDHKEYYYTRLHQQDLSLEQKIGKDAEVKTKKTLKQFLS